MNREIVMLVILLFYYRKLREIFYDKTVKRYEITKCKFRDKIDDSFFDIISCMSY